MIYLLFCCFFQLFLSVIKKKRERNPFLFRQNSYSALIMVPGSFQIFFFRSQFYPSEVDFLLWSWLAVLLTIHVIVSLAFLALVALKERNFHNT